MPEPQYLEAFGDVDISVGIDGWTATVPGGYRTLPAIGIISAMLAFIFIFSIAALLSNWLLFLLVSPFLLAILYGVVNHTRRAATSTRFTVRNGDLRLQHRILGMDRGQPALVQLQDIPPAHIEGVVGLQVLTLGPHTMPVHAAPDDLLALCSLLNESRVLATEDQDITPIPAALKAMLAAQRAAER